ncbi:MAG: SprT family zinc-dependent metalloprotease [Limnobacter sp.]|nr:SprT family zinc-dependent metalloprotease [Limnobacter sp.]
MRRTLPEETATITLGTTHLQYTLRRSKRKSVGLQVTDRGLVVSAPLRLSHPELLRVLRDREVWILSRLSYWRQCQARMTSLSNLLEKGSPLPVAGEYFEVTYNSRLKRSALNSELKVLELKVPPPRNDEQAQLAGKEVERLLRKQAKPRFARIAEQLAEREQLPDFSIHLSSARCRWGSCNSDGKLRLNWRLMFYPDDIVKYVIAHEMAHLREMNHSDQFWREVEKLMPNYERVHKYLSEMSPAKVPLA